VDSGRPGSYRVADYAVAPTSAHREANTQRRRLPPPVITGVRKLWATRAPCQYDADRSARLGL